MDRRSIALDYFAGGCNCAQSVLAAFSNGMGTDSAAALKISTAFGGGIVGMGQTCGAVTGALMAIGLRFGMTRGDDKAAKEKTRDIGKELIHHFESAFGSTTCKELLGCDLSTPEGIEEARSSGIFTTKCTSFVGKTVQLLEELIEK
jgi:C_GCAxxG_C_C family probable redox protein